MTYILRAHDGTRIAVVESPDDYAAVEGVTGRYSIWKHVQVSERTIRAVCSICDGTGDDPIGELVACPECAGTGLEEAP